MPIPSVSPKIRLDPDPKMKSHTSLPSKIVRVLVGSVHAGHETLRSGCIARIFHELNTSVLAAAVSLAWEGFKRTLRLCVLITA